MITDFFQDTDKVTQVLQSSIKRALLQHKQAGNPVCEWRDGKVVWVSPENILVKK